MPTPSYCLDSNILIYDLVCSVHHRCLISQARRNDRYVLRASKHKRSCYPCISIFLDSGTRFREMPERCLLKMHCCRSGSRADRAWGRRGILCILFPLRLAALFSSAPPDVCFGWRLVGIFLSFGRSLSSCMPYSLNFCVVYLPIVTLVIRILSGNLVRYNDNCSE